MIVVALGAAATPLQPRGLFGSALQCSAVQCSAVQCSAVQCSAVQCIAAPAAGLRCRAATPTLEARFPPTSAAPSAFRHVPPALAAAPHNALRLSGTRFAALWTSLPLAMASRTWLLCLVGAASRCLWLTPEHACRIVDDLAAHHGWDHTEAAAIQVCTCAPDLAALCDWKHFAVAPIDPRLETHMYTCGSHRARTCECVSP
jgi:hypothetical protein